MHWEIKKATFKPDYSIEVEFLDGLSGIVYVKQSKLIRVFAPLKDKSLFLKGYVKYGAITWKTQEYELDLAPDTMHEEIKKNNGVYILGERSEK